MGNDNCITYRIDKDGIIVFVSGNWDQFALANKGNTLLQNMVLDKPLFDFISDWRSRHLYELLIDDVREKKRSITFSYRCDAPALRRFMTMEIVPLEQGFTEFRSCIEKEQRRQAQPLLDIDTLRGEEFLLICAWCKKINMDDAHWEEIEQAVETKQLFHTSVLPNLTHGVCPDCLNTLKAKIS